MINPTINILNPDLTLKLQIKNLIFSTWQRNMFKPTLVKLKLPPQYFTKINIDDIIHLVGTHDIAVVIKKRYYSEVKNREVNEYVEVEALTGLSILNWRRVIPPSGHEYDSASGAVETVLKHFVNSQCVNPENSDRKIPNLIIAEDLQRGQNIAIDLRFQKIGDELYKLAEAYDLGHHIYLDAQNRQLIYDVFEGVDKSASQTTNNRVIFSDAFKNIYSEEIIVDGKGEANYAYVGGQGTGIDRVIAEVGTTTGYGRKELFVDARDSLDADLPLRGQEELAKRARILSIKARVLPDRKNAEYRKDWDLGDIVTVWLKKFGIRQDLRITQITEIYDKDGFKLDVVFGKEVRTFYDAVKNSLQSLDVIKNV